jgi:hypothetical protein
MALYSVIELDDILMRPNVCDDFGKMPDLVYPDVYMNEVILPDTDKLKCAKAITTCRVSGQEAIDKSKRVSESYLTKFCFHSEKLKKCILELYGPDTIEMGNTYYTYSGYFSDDADMAYTTTFELLKYSEGGFFLKHVDRLQKKLNDRIIHTHVVLIYPPSHISSYTGGNIIFYDTNGNAHTIRPSEFTGWTCVMFERTVPHEITPVTSGARYVFKGPLYTINRNYVDNEERLED